VENGVSFAEKAVWITGASSGIGAALARAFAADGARVILSGRNADALAEVAADCPGSRTLAFDTTDLAVLPDIAAAAGPIDILVNNAGISQRSLFLDTAFDVYRTVMEVDFFAPLRLTQLALPAMVGRGSGAIVNLASVAGRIGSPLRTGYCAAKHAMVGWSDALRAEIAQYGVAVHVVEPGFVRTNVATNAIQGDGSRRGHSDAAIEAGISPVAAAATILAGIAAGTREILVGDGPEMGLVALRGSDPDRLFDLMAGAAPRVDR
jgi:short-subunit dehydrogenase